MDWLSIITGSHVGALLRLTGNRRGVNISIVVDLGLVF